MAKKTGLKPPRKLKIKRPRGRPPKRIPAGHYNESGFFAAVREWLSPKERLIFKPSVERLRALSVDLREDGGLYPARAVKAVVDAVKASEIRVEYVWRCLGMKRNQYNRFIKHVQMDAAGAEEESTLLAKGYAIARYYQERYDVLDDVPIKKSGATDSGLTFEQFEDLVKIAVHDWEGLKRRFEISRQRPKPISR